MSKIRLLPSALINQIAAGEVIERPASVVKELVENAVDAGAGRIEVIIQDGGKQLIQVGDDGEGMGPEDLKTCFQRHCTSKITEKSDLNQVQTLGFRGEALPSIASVAQVRARSAVDDLNSHEIVISSGNQESFQACAGPKGTQVQVRNLFFNVPARRKFLKKKEYEYRIITNVIRQFMLALPNLAFRFESDGREVYNLQSADLKQRIRDLYGRKFMDSLLPVHYEKHHYSVSGFVGNLDLTKKRQGEQYLFLNGRAIQSRMMNSAVYTSYRSLLQRGEFPFFALKLNVPPEQVDVNVHPAKLEVRFQDEWRIYYVVKTAVTQALEDLLSVIPGFFPSSDSHMIPAPANQWSQQKQGQMTFPVETAPRGGSSEFSTGDDHSEMSPVRIQKARQRIEAMMTPPPGIPAADSSGIWQVHNKYLITEVKSGIIIIDQHVAHERILFEAAQKALESGGLPSQTVLFPQTVKFQPDEFSKLTEIVPYLEKIGFQLREFGENTIIIEGVPPDVYLGSEGKIVREILDRYLEHHELGSGFMDHIAATYACKAAIKAGYKLEPEEIKTIVDRLFATRHPYFCPHGRPIVVNLSVEELDQRFERI